MLNRKRLLALGICLGLVLVLAASSACIVYAAGHCCVAARHCPLCHTVALAAQTLRVLGLLLAFTVLFLLHGVLSSAHFRLQSAPCAAKRTLIAWKIRLND